MQEVRVGGVPEHFNYPWISSIEQESFFNKGINLSWKNCYGGTGEMISDLKKENIDLAIMLTEGCIKEIESGTPFTIIQKYIETPLIWGVFVNSESQLQQLEDLKHKTAAISRLNSGSHLMTYVLADNQSWSIKEQKVKECQDLKGAFKSLKEYSSDYLLWEKYSTLPYLPSENLRHIGDCPTPWPCFVIVCRTEFQLSNQALIQNILEIINSTTISIKENQNLKTELSIRYQMSSAEVKEWLNITEWSQEILSQDVYNSILTKIKSYGIIS